MKKILILILILFSFSLNVQADSLSFNYRVVNGKIQMEILSNDKVISYDDAIKEYALDEYLEIFYNDRDVYFYLGNEISYDEYIVGKASLEADRRVKVPKFDIRVKNTDEFIDAVDNIYRNKITGNYTLIYTEFEFQDFDIDRIEKFYEENILTDLYKNVYKFDEYGFMTPVRYMPIISKTETKIYLNNVMMTDKEYNMVEEFSKKFIPLLENESDYEKVLGVYTFIKSTTKYIDYGTMKNALSGYVSPYDNVFNGKTDCIGNSITFQYFIEQLGIESYIVDRVADVDDNKFLFATSHTYNVVKLDGKWYILDIAAKEDTFLLACRGEYLLDLYSIELDFAHTDYLVNNSHLPITYEFDYDYLSEVINDILGVKKDENDDDNKSKMNVSTVVIIVSLIVLAFIFVIVIISLNRR